ncbi:hypothetical protein UFOVP1349_41 [uncultured Caudovirales phage]|uniref:Uncharacterized protein n=1 Tax=uncultured Caudovirales phage TaxID=2100421 RepID=A0A6J5S1K8_9CAUD|nr:hypothetical protein UFOVP925_2 [uncultured Caudovirales phage]CAB4184327.1 hypothetical protein UFOVP1097_47 [uncultured Caudovirales phage]CAB4200342.1 hypothetical protein UFOVP1349_41 [uncultured Caudovirales phage]CAB4214190.1 hypothetical protein UFOVP1456_21 [uncultured Caudovirales phage]
MPLIYPVGFMAAGGSWQTAYTKTISGTGAQSFNTENFRMQLVNADMTKTGGTQMRLTFTSHATNTLVVTDAYLQQSATSGYTTAAPSYSTTPIQISCSALNAGSPTGPWTLTAAGGPWVTDAIATGFTAGMVTNGLTIAFKFNNGSNMQLAASTSGSGTTASYKTPGVDEASTVTVSGYVASTDVYKSILVSKVELFV